MAAADEGAPKQVIPSAIWAHLNDVTIELVMGAAELVELLVRLDAFPVRAAQSIAVHVSHNAQLLGVTDGAGPS